MIFGGGEYIYESHRKPTEVLEISYDGPEICKGLLPVLDTFKHRELTTEPKFVKKRRQLTDKQQDIDRVYS